MVAPSDRAQSSVDRIYEAVKDMTITYRLKPGERLNEGALAKRLGASRTPLREALNRLNAEGFLTFEVGKGFFCREFKPRDIFELYQLRAVLEAAAVRLVCEAASEAEIDALDLFIRDTGPADGGPVEGAPVEGGPVEGAPVEGGSDHGGHSAEDLVSFDEQFHETLMAMTRNAEMQRVLRNVNARIKFFRWIDMEQRRNETQGEHRQILAALRARNPDLAAERMRRHIERRLDQITEAIKEGYSRIYLSGS